eukprot:g12690.t1
MSKLNIDNLKKGIVQILDGSKEKQRKCVFYPSSTRPEGAERVVLVWRFEVCVLGDAVHCEQAQRVRS